MRPGQECKATQFGEFAFAVLKHQRGLLPGCEVGVDQGHQPGHLFT